jgi:hypothetical protein
MIDTMQLNPWTAALFDGNSTYEYQIIGWTLFFAALELGTARLMRGSKIAERLAAAQALSSKRGDVGTGTVLFAANRDDRECHSAANDFSSYLACSIHSLCVSIGAVAVISAQDFSKWPYFLSFSLGYWLADLVMWTIPAADYLLCIHHLIVVVITYPIGSDAGATLFGAGDLTLSRKICAYCFLCELSTVFLCIRWFVLHCLPTDNAHAPSAYRVASVALLTTWMPTRFIVFPALVLNLYIPVYSSHKAQGQIFAWVCGLVGLLCVFALSTAFTHRMLRNGIKSFITLHYQERLCDQIEGEEEIRHGSSRGRDRGGLTAVGPEEPHAAAAAMKSNASLLPPHRVFQLLLVLPQLALFASCASCTGQWAEWVQSFALLPSWTQSWSWWAVVLTLGECVCVCSSANPR